MATGSTLKEGSRAVLASDAGLLTAAALGVVVALAVVLGTGSHASNVAGIIGVAAGVFGGPLLAWMLHGRRVDGTANLGAFAGYLAGGAVVFAVMMLADGVGALVMEIGLSATKGPGAVAVTIAIALAFLAAVIWLDIDAARDLSAQRRRHVRLDIARLVATVVYAAFAAGVIVKVAAGSEPDAGDNTANLLLVPGAVGAVVVTVADAIARSTERRPHGHLISGA